MKKLIATLLLILNFSLVFGQGIKPEYERVISDFINCVKSGNRKKLADKIAFPFERQYPIPDIKNKTEFLRRYKEVFDDQLIKMILDSKPSADWTDVGWRGIMLFRGDLWLDYDGRLVAVNYQSEAEKKKRTALIEMEKNQLHRSIKQFEIPVQLLETSKFKIRIDDLGEGNYRYASWSLKNKMSDQPDLILKNGKFISEGSGGNHRFEFKSGDYVYDCLIMVMRGKDTPPAMLTIYKGDKEILSQAAKVIKK
ncbi:hypothetical protein [Pedobacter caeni]|uniref:Uncharacterized protein n=1 Tax=Pedobacter caeni TaxID=288992 RepID=A0A1M5A6L9_9SPHI|nr:hypothetical protein [Pedobacter caeni]SHF25910.1 hypothetical protein SAMN04488522_102611 [Pedobacter caeni]